uniref:Reverse transcriptase domain-containing protein n=1 Tax=Glossina austeni TaxID=7395 RepID=A0A1A9V9J4_GLOAU
MCPYIRLGFLSGANQHFRQLGRVHARVVSICKIKTIHTLEGLRPISILPAVSKIVEHILKDYSLSAALNLISSSQCATLTNAIRRDVNCGLLTPLVALDLSKAFNSVNHLGLILGACWSIFTCEISVCGD